jgi:hypothetical protein
MSGRLTTACLSLVFLGTGCEDGPRSQLISPNEPSTLSSRLIRPVRRAPATEAVARRVLDVGQTIVLANPTLGIRPLFVTVGSPQPEIFHLGNAIEGCQIIVSEGLVKRCKNDDELAAVLCMELGKIVSEREASTPPSTRQVERRLPPGETIGHDSGGTFGSPDGSRRMELAKQEQARRAERAVAPSPDALARKYLAQTSFASSAIDSVMPLLHEAEKHYRIEKQFRGEEKR